MNYDERAGEIKERIKKILNPVTAKIEIRIKDISHGAYESQIEIRGTGNRLFAKKTSYDPFTALSCAEMAIKRQIIRCKGIG